MVLGSFLKYVSFYGLAILQIFSEPIVMARVSLRSVVIGRTDGGTRFCSILISIIQYPALKPTSFDTLL